MKIRILTLLLFLFCPSLPGAEPFDPPALYLSWRRDPTTTITIKWHSLSSENRLTLVHYQRTDETRWRAEKGTSHPMVYSDRTVHVVELTGLNPATVYRFRPGDNARTFQFRTLPAALNDSLRFIVGGDTYGRGHWYHRLDPRNLVESQNDEYYKTLREVNRQAARQNPAFIAIGGDITYSDGHPGRADRWHTWLSAWKEDMVTADSLLIPILPVIGNHETADNTYKIEWYSQTESYDPATQAPYFYNLFIPPGAPAYRVLDFGRYLSLILLDSGHTHLVKEQTEWLARILKARQTIPHKFAIYHVPAYPSYRSYDDRISSTVRKYWVPLFEQFDLTAAFEHHDHTYKRTHPIRNNQIHPEGVLYLGDGAWAKLRTPRKPKNRWYLAETAREYHFILVTLKKDHLTYRAINEEGRIFDQYPPEMSIQEP